MPRNVAPSVARVPGVTLVDLADLRAAGAIDDGAVLDDLARAEAIVEGELERYLRWQAGRSAAVSVSRLRADVEAYAQSQIDQATRGVPDDVRPLVEDRVRRAVHQLAHGPTKRLLKAAEDGDERLVEVLVRAVRRRPAPPGLTLLPPGGSQGTQTRRRRGRRRRAAGRRRGSAASTGSASGSGGS